MPTITHHQWTKEKASVGKFIIRVTTFTVFVLFYKHLSESKLNPNTFNHKNRPSSFIFLHSTLFVVLSASRNYTALAIIYCHTDKKKHLFIFIIRGATSKNKIQKFK